MSQAEQKATPLQTQYAAQLSTDLGHNADEQTRIVAEIAVLEEQLRALQRDQALLTGMQQALGTDTRLAISATAPSVPQQSAVESRKSKPRKPTTTAKGTASQKDTVGSSSEKATGKSTNPTLGTLIHTHLTQQRDPRSTAEVTAALSQAHPERNIKATVVRTTLEALVAKSQVHRSRHGSSVFYTAAEVPESSATELRADAATISG